MTRVKTSRGKSEVELATLCLSRRSETREAGATGRSLIHALRNDSSLVTDRCGAVRVAVTRGFELKRQPTFLVAYRDAIAFHRPRFATDIACKAHERNADISRHGTSGHADTQFSLGNCRSVEDFSIKYPCFLNVSRKRDKRLFLP